MSVLLQQSHSSRTANTVRPAEAAATVTTAADREREPDTQTVSHALCLAAVHRLFKIIFQKIQITL